VKPPTLTGSERTGRPSKKTKKLVAELLAAIRDGAPFNLACAAGGIHVDTFGDWRQRDPKFAQQVDQAAAKGALQRLKKIEQHGGENWSALAGFQRQCRERAAELAAAGALQQSLQQPRTRFARRFGPQKAQKQSRFTSHSGYTSDSAFHLFTRPT
jgi:hypothetical protein